MYSQRYDGDLIESMLTSLQLPKRLYGVKSSNPLRILYCGSDFFSSACLRALHQEQRANPDGIVSIDVLCRPGKRTGRSLKIVREVPIKGVAIELGLTVHERDTFTGWDLPRPDGEPINLIIAVSFGLFVPPRILKSAAYGGLNIHPSLLPNFRGAAPLQYMIMHGEKYAGVTLQTLDHKSFDHGVILAQTPAHSLKLDLYQKPTFDGLLSLVTPLGADLLVRGIRSRAFVPPLEQPTLPKLSRTLIHAPKITPKDREIDWANWDAVTIGRRHRALGPLWNMALLSDKRKIRIKMDGIKEVALPKELRVWSGEGKILDGCEDKEVEGEQQKPGALKCSSLVVKAHDGTELRLPFAKHDEGIIIAGKEMGVRISHITIEGMGRKDARKASEYLQN